MNIRIRPDKLIGLIKQQSSQAQQARQVANRLRSLLPLRFKEIKSRYLRQSKKGASAERHALADKSYEEMLFELAAINSQAHAAKINYETHQMLHMARQSLRLFHR